MTIIERGSVLIVALILGFIIFSRLDNLFQSNLISLNNVSIDEQKDLYVQNEGVAPIIFKGELAKEEPKTNNVTEIVNDKPREIQQIEFEITTEDDLNSILDKFVNLGFIEDKNTFKGMLEDLRLTGYITPGVYKVPANIKNLELAETITIANNEEE